MKFHSYTHFEKLYEGMYDKLTGDITDEIWKLIHTTQKIYELDNQDNAFERNYENFTSEKAKLTFNMKIIIYRDEKENSSCHVDGSTSSNDELPSDIEILIGINPKTEPKVYNELNALIQDTVRHELEHLTQSGKNKKPFRPKTPSDAYKNRIQKIPSETWRYFTLKDEIPAMVHGLYRRAKILKQPLDITMEDYLNYFREINVIDDEKFNKIMKKWLEFAKTNLPAAIYSK